jgi:hypothetical protein
MIGGRRPLQGRKIGDRRVRGDRPHSPYFRYTGAGMLTAKEEAAAPGTGVALAWPNTVITNVPYRPEEPALFERGGRLDQHIPPDQPAG